MIKEEKRRVGIGEEKVKEGIKEEKGDVGKRGSNRLLERKSSRRKRNVV